MLQLPAVRSEQRFRPKAEIVLSKKAYKHLIEAYLELLLVLLEQSLSDDGFPLAMVPVLIG